MAYKAILADIDGTMIEGGDFRTIPMSLELGVYKIRKQGIPFNLASGRAYFEQEMFHESLRFGIEPLSNEGILYEASCVKLFESDVHHQLGGLTREQRESINVFLNENGLVQEMAPQVNNDRYETTVGYVTPTFIFEGKTDTTLLERTFNVVKPVLESQFNFLEVVMTADAIDINAKGVTKAKPTVKYSQLTGIALSDMVAIGDSGNDMAMFQVVGDAGGFVVYVGKREDQEAIVRGYPHHFVPETRGPVGTAKALEHVLANM